MEENTFSSSTQPIKLQFKIQIHEATQQKTKKKKSLYFSYFIAIDNVKKIIYGLIHGLNKWRKRS